MSEIDASGNIIGMEEPIIMIASDDDDPTIASFISYEKEGQKYFMFINKGEYESEIFEIPMSFEYLASLPEEAFENARDFQETIYPHITDKFSKYSVQRMNDEEMSLAYHCIVIGARRNSIYTFGNKPIKKFEDRDELEEYIESLDIIKESMTYNKFIPVFEPNRYVSINEVIDEHDNKTAAGVLFVARNTKNALLGKRSKDDAEAGTWALVTIPLNVVINNNDEAKRETSKLIKEQVGNVGEFTLDEVYVNESRGFKFYNYVASVGAEFKPTSDWETEKFQWFSLDEIIGANPKKLHYGVKILKDNALDKLKKYFA